MLPPLIPFCPISAAKIAGLKATVLLLLVMLMKSKLLRVKMSLLGSFLGLIMLTGFLVSTGSSHPCGRGCRGLRSKSESA